MSDPHLATEAAPSRRLFVAIALPAAVKDALVAMQGELRTALPPRSVRWVARAQLHLTLVFLGAVASGRIEALADVLRATCAALPSLELNATRLGCFAQHGHPRVVWVGVDDRAQVLPRAQALLAQATRDFTSVPPPATFTAHLTLGRCTRAAPAVATTLAALARQAAEREFGHWMSRSVVLMQSELAPRGARYRCLEHFPLACA